MEDILDCGPDFVAYTIFDFEGEINTAGTAAVMNWTKHPEAYLDSDQDSQLCGPLLLVTKK
jgi:hypothetical protein